MLNISGNILYVICRSSLMTWSRDFAYFQKVVSFLITKFWAFFKRVKAFILLWSRDGVEKKRNLQMNLKSFTAKARKVRVEMNKSFCCRNGVRFLPTSCLCEELPGCGQVLSSSLSLDTWSRLQIPILCPSAFWPILSCWGKHQRPWRSRPSILHTMS